MEKLKLPQGQYRTTETNWDKVAPYVKYRYKCALSRLPLSGTVYELGAGIGVGLAFLAKSRPDLNFIGFEMSFDAVNYGMNHFSKIPNFKLVVCSSHSEMLGMMEDNSFLIALEVLEHLTDLNLELFKKEVVPKLSECFFSFPYNQRNIEGTDHLQSFDIYKIFELFPGFEVIFIRRGSIKFIGYWRKRRMLYLSEQIGVKGEDVAIKLISPSYF